MRRERVSAFFGTGAGPGRVAAMDGVRGLAVLLVFFVHFHSNFGHWAPEAWSPASRWLATAGHSGVDLFFALSGFLIYGILVTKQPPLGAFWKRRIQRIYPVFAAVLAIYVAASMRFPERSKIPDEGAVVYVAQNALLLPGVLDLKPIITVAWSLSYEAFYYLLLPAVTIAAARSGLGSKGRILLVSALAAGAIGWVLSDPARYYPAIPFSPLVLIGFLLFLPGMLAWELRNGGSSAAAGAAGLVATVVAVPFLFPRAGDDAGPGSEDPLVTLARTLFVAVSLLPFALECFTRRGWLARCFEYLPLQWLGAMSYSFYLAHSLALHAVALAVGRWHGPAEPSAAAFLALFAAALATATIASAGLFAAVEKPFSLPARRTS